MRQLQAEKGMGVSQSKAAIKAGEWMNTWIEKHKSPKLAPATLTSYRNNFRIHIRPYIGDIVLYPRPLVNGGHFNGAVY